MNIEQIPVSPAEKPLIWISWIGGAIALIAALFAPQGAGALVLFSISIAVLAIAIVVTTQRRRRRRASSRAA